MKKVLIAGAARTPIGALNGFSMEGRALVVNEANEQGKGGGGGGGGFGGGRRPGGPGGGGGGARSPYGPPRGPRN